MFDSDDMLCYNTEGMKDEVITVQYATLLYDFYGSLLGEKQAEVMELYHEYDMSLSEIAAELNMTRQAVHYTLKKSEAFLDGLENKLGLIASYNENRKKADSIIAMLRELDITDDNRNYIIKTIEELTE